jgi:hypothetical protein
MIVENLWPKAASPWVVRISMVILNTKFVSFPHSGMSNTSSLQRQCILLARQSHKPPHCCAVRLSLFSSNRCRDYLKERAARLRARQPQVYMPGSA